MLQRLLAFAVVVTASCGPAVRTDSRPDTTPEATSAANPAPAAAPGAQAAHDAKAIETPALLASPLPDDPTKTTIHRLSNGMTVYISTDRQEPTITAHVVVRAGSRHDPEQSTGLAHYLEHMVFKGTSKLGTLDYTKEKPHLDRIASLYGDLRKPGAERDKILAEIDAETQKSAAYAIPNELDALYSRLGITGLNAFTADDATVYITQVPKNRLEQWARVEAARYADPVFRLFWPELEAVYEEKNRSLDNPAWRLEEALMRGLFPKAGYGWSSGIGEIDHLKSPAYADMEAFFHRYYTPGNMAIVLSGDVDESALPLLEREMGVFQRPAGPAAPAGQPAKLSGRRAVDVSVPADEGVVIGWPLVPANHPDRSALEVMDVIMFDARTRSGMLARELLLPQKVARASSNPRFFREAGLFELSADALAGQSIDDVERLLRDVIAKLQRGEFTDRDLATGVLGLEIAEQRQIETNRGRVQMIENAFIEGVAWEDAVARLARMRKVTKADVLRVARRYLTDDLLVIRKVKQASTPPKITKPGITAVAVDPTRRSAFAQAVLDTPVVPIEPVSIVQGRDYQRLTIPTGPLIMVPNQRNELFTIRYHFDVGKWNDRLVCFALDLFAVSGAGTRSPEQFARELQELGITVDLSCSRYEAMITISGIDRNLEAGLALVKSWLAEPVFDDATVKRRVTAVLTDRASAITTPQRIAAALQQHARFGADTEFLVVPTNHQLEVATPAQLKAIIAAFLHYKHRAAYFGPRDRADVAAVIAIGDGVRATAKRKPMRFRPPNALLVTDQPTAQTHVWITWPRPAASAADRASGTLYSEYISTVLYQEIREARGLAYAVFGGYGPGEYKLDEASLAAYVGTQSDKAHEAIDAMLTVLRNNVDAERFALAKATVAESYRAARIPPRAIAQAVYQWEDEGETADPRAARHTRAQKLSAAQVQTWAHTALRRPSIYSVVGPRSALDDARLAKLAPVTVVPVEKLFGF